MDALSLPATSASSTPTPLPTPRQRLAEVTGPGIVRSRPAAPARRQTRRDDEAIDVQALAKQLGITPTELQAAIQRTQTEQQDGWGSGGGQTGQDGALPWTPPVQQREMVTARTAKNLGVEPQGLEQALLSVTELPAGANPLQHAARQLDVDPNALMTAMHENGLSFVDEYA